MKNTVKKILLAVIGVFAILTIAISDDMYQNANSGSYDHSLVIYPLFLLFSIIYLQWLIQRYLTPLHQLTQDKYALIKTKISNKIGKGFFSLGHLCLLFYFLAYLLALLDRGDPVPPIFIYSGMCFIGLGIIERTNNIVIVLIQQIKDNPDNIQK